MELIITGSRGRQPEVCCTTRYAIELLPQSHPEQEKPAPRVSAVVVSRNRAALLRRCLESLEASEERESLQIIVVDNGSKDGSATWDAEFPNVQFVRLPKNFGLTKAMNIGWRAADAQYVFFLHDDAAVEPSTIRTLAGVLDADPEVAAVCPLLVDAEGRPAPQLGSFPPGGEWRPATVSDDQPLPVEYPRGAAFMMRVFLIKAIRQIDEHYGQYGADADLAVQIAKAGKKILLVPTARARHEGGGNLSGAEKADLQQARTVFMGKYPGYGNGRKAWIGAVLGSLFSFRLGEFRYLASGQKIDGTQP